MDASITDFIKTNLKPIKELGNKFKEYPADLTDGKIIKFLLQFPTLEYVEVAFRMLQQIRFFTKEDILKA